MDNQSLRDLLSRVQDGEASVENALHQLRLLPYEDLGFAKVDHHRALRRGFPEVIFGEGKTIEQVVSIAERLAGQGHRVLVTRVEDQYYTTLRQRFPDAVYHQIARAITVCPDKKRSLRSGITIVCAGTADLPVAEEAAVTAEIMDNAVERVYDVGVAGIHRLFDHLPLLQRSRVVIAVAGMEGALPSVIAGLVSVPVIAVPTSVGYGASFGGVTALLAMLCSCSPGVAVVNIDNGFGAGYMGAMINCSKE